MESPFPHKPVFTPYILQESAGGQQGQAQPFCLKLSLLAPVGP